MRRDWLGAKVTERVAAASFPHGEDVRRPSGVLRLYSESARTVSTGDMLQTLGVGPASPVSTLIQRRPLRVSANGSVGATARAMRQAKASSALTEDGKAIVTDTDLARALASGLGPEAAVAAVYVPEPITIPASASIVDAAADMLHNEIRHLVVTDHGDVLGVISLRDVVAVLLEALDPAVWVATMRATAPRGVSASSNSGRR